MFLKIKDVQDDRGGEERKVSAAATKRPALRSRRFAVQANLAGKENMAYFCGYVRRICSCGFDGPGTPWP